MNEHTGCASDTGINKEADIAIVKDYGADFLRILDAAEIRHGDSDELLLARHRANEAVMWAVKHITR